MTLDAVTLGEALVAIRSHGRLAQGDALSASLAGAETNVAIGLARLGHRAAWRGVLGEDAPGDLIARTLRAEGVDITGVRRDGGAPTGVMLVDMPAALPPSVTYHRRGSAGASLSPQDVAAAPAARLWHLSGITPALSASAADAVSAAIDQARATGAIISFDVNFRAKLWPSDVASSTLRPLARRADVVIASEDELALVADGHTELDQAKSLLAAGVREVVVKRGRHGAVHIDSSGATPCAAHPVTEVNSIGAGDAFTAGYLSGLLDGEPVAERLRRGALSGALAVSGVGDWEQAPNRSDLVALTRASGEANR
jgi:2-dehydro-3-deoxygluconokinase